MPNSNSKLLIEAQLDELKEILFEDLKQTAESIEEKLNDELELKFKIIKNQLDIRIESIISSIHQYREDFMKELDKIKENYKKSFNDTDEFKNMRFTLDFMKKSKEFDFETDYTEFMKTHEMINKSQTMLQGYLNDLHKIQYNPSTNLFQLKELIGDLTMPHSIKLKSSFFINPRVQATQRFAYHYKRQGKILLTGIIEDSVLIYDFNKGLILKFKHNLIESPNCVCMGLNDEIYVSCVSKPFGNSIVRFKSDFTLKRVFHVPGSRITCMDSNHVYVYLAQEDKITVWNCKIGILINSANIKADVLKVKNDFLYVINKCVFNRNEKTRMLQDIECGSNAIFILNKKTFELIKKIEFDDWLQPSGLIIDEYDNIYTIAYALDNNKVISEHKYLHVINQKGGITQKCKVSGRNFDETELISVYDNKIIALVNDRIQVIEFDRNLYQLF